MTAARGTAGLALLAAALLGACSRPASQGLAVEAVDPVGAASLARVAEIAQERSLERAS